jgi:hypothetical protein
MTTYKQPKKVASPVVGAADIKENLKSPYSNANVRVGEYKPTKTSGIVTRGNGCATKGKTARGPMA